MNFWDSLWLLIWTFFFISYLFVLFNIIGDLLRDSETSGIKKAIWVVFLLALPALTALTYLIVRGKGMSERAVAQVQRNQDATRAYIRDAAGARTPAEEIATAKELLDAGTIKQDEFDMLKARALGK